MRVKRVWQFYALSCRTLRTQTLEQTREHTHTHKHILRQGRPQISAPCLPPVWQHYFLQLHTHIHAHTHYLQQHLLWQQWLGFGQLSHNLAIQNEMVLICTAPPIFIQSLLIVLWEPQVQSLWYSIYYVTIGLTTPYTVGMCNNL